MRCATRTTTPCGNWQWIAPKSGARPCRTSPLEIREAFHQRTGNPFDMKPVQSLVEGDRAVVKCTGDKKLKGIYLVLFFVKTSDGWRTWLLRNSPPSRPLSEFLTEKPAAVGN